MSAVLNETANSGGVSSPPPPHGLKSPVHRLAIFWECGNNLRVTVLRNPEPSRVDDDGGKVVNVRLSGEDAKITDASNKISSCLKIFAEHFKFGRQEDAHEFLRYVIDACHNTSLRLKKLRTKKGGNTVVKEFFGGALQSQVTCLPCGACGDLNRNVLAPAAPYVKKDYLYAQETADNIAALLNPQSGLYYDTWVDGAWFCGLHVDSGLPYGATASRFHVNEVKPVVGWGDVQAMESEAQVMEAYAHQEPVQCGREPWPA